MGLLTAYDKFIQQALKYGFSLFGTAKSGQITSYRTGDDGNLKKGYPKSGARFVDNGDGTITDNATGLMWVKDPLNNPGTPFNILLTWNQAVDSCNGLTFAGHNDWRLPNPKELLSINDFEQDDPSINETFFPNTESDNYWTSTTSKFDTTDAWYIDFVEGSMTLRDKTLGAWARPVRLGIPKN